LLLGVSLGFFKFYFLPYLLWLVSIEFEVSELSEEFVEKEPLFSSFGLSLLFAGLLVGRSFSSGRLEVLGDLWQIIVTARRIRLGMARRQIFRFYFCLLNC
jgi:hypothetical protein